MGEPAQRERKEPLKYLKLVMALGLLVLLVAAGIFLFSAQSSEASSKTSSAVVSWLLERLYPDYDQLSARQRRALIHQYQEPVRKAAHGLEFMLLGTLLYLFLHGLKVRRPSVFAWIGGTLYAATDELHQTMVSGRGGMWQDVCIDSGGVLAGILLGVALLALFHGIVGKKPDKKDA